MTPGGGVAGWSIRHPVGVVMMALAVIVLGLFSLGRLGVDLLPHIIYPEVRVRILDPGVPGVIMEDQITRQLEEQLAITEDAIGVQSQTSEGRSSVDLTFPYGKDIDIALRDASSRLDRAKRFLPDTIDPPVIFKRDPSQIPALEFVVSSPLKDPVELREWLDYGFAKWFLNLPGVASTEVGGGPLREVVVLPDQARLAGHGLSMNDVIAAIERANLEVPGGAVRMQRHEISGRTAGRFQDVESIASLPLRSNASGAVLRLTDVADVLDSAEDEKLRIRLNGVPGLKLAIQKQPQANTVEVVDAVYERLAFLAKQGLVPEDVRVDAVEDQAVYVRHALANAANAAISGALLAMLVVFLFLGDLRRTLIIGTGIPFAVMVALVLMDAGGLTLNIMTLGGLALGMGMLVDNTIVMLENIYRHQREGESSLADATHAADEVHGAIIASSSTSLAAVLPFLFIGGLVGLLFQELIATISAAIVASLVVAITVVPALAARVPVGRSGILRRAVDAVMGRLAAAYAWCLGLGLKLRWLVVAGFAAALFVYAVPVFQNGKHTMLPEMDDGKVRIEFTADAGTGLDATDAVMTRVEKLLLDRDDVESVYSQVGGFVFGRSQYEATNRGRIAVQLVPIAERELPVGKWIAEMRKEVAKLQMAGVRVRIRAQGIRGLNLTSSDDDFSLRVRGEDLETLARIGQTLVERLDGVPGLSNVRHSSEDLLQELAVRVDRERAAALGLTVEDVGRAVRIALQGIVATDFIEGDRKFDVRVRLPRDQVDTPEALEKVLLFPAREGAPAVHLRDVGTVDLVTTPSNIRRDRQQRILEVAASIDSGAAISDVQAEVARRLEGLELPQGYSLYDGGAADALGKSETLLIRLLGLALFLVLVVMAVQYESLRNPLAILVSVPFAAIGVALAIDLLDLPLSMPVWLGMIMLTGIVVNNAIVLLEYVEIARARGAGVTDALIEAGRLRLRPILMTTLTTVVGMAPLAAGLGEGAEMLQPLAITIVFGLSFSTLVSLLLVPAVYRVVAREGRRTAPVHGLSPSQHGAG